MGQVVNIYRQNVIRNILQKLKNIPPDILYAF